MFLHKGVVARPLGLHSAPQRRTIVRFGTKGVDMKISASVLRVTAGVAAVLTAFPAKSQTVSDYLERIAAVDDSGPMLNAVLAINPDAAKEEAAARKISGPLAGNRC